ncbi:MAG: hypothetical protein ABS46_01850 [Cytophagaceae bacterium SCN 52-12]|nr:MAG: hypothetical protein ABS46_01850 [Cytophagaceae bacterium SCN 52-12]
MKKNLGLLDKAIRIAAALAIGILYYTGAISGTWAIVLGALAIVFVITAFISFCPLYLPFGINTFKNRKK